MKTTFSPRQSALLAGVSLLLMVAAVIVAFPHTTALIVKGNTSKTVKAVLDAGVWFRVGIVGWFVVLLLDLVVTVALHEFLRRIHHGISLLTAWLRLFYTALFGVAILNLVAVLVLLQGGSLFSSFTTAQLHSLVMLFLSLFQYFWLFALGFFGLHLLGLGVLVWKSDFIPRVFGILLVMAALGYTLDILAYLVMPSYAAWESTIKAVVSAPNAIGELAFAFWLLVKGGKELISVTSQQKSAPIQT